MHPLLFKLGPFSVHTYGFLIAVGFLAGIWVIKRLAVRAAMNPDRMMDLAFWMLLTGFIGARALFVFTRLEYFLSNPIDIFKVWEGGLVFFGGLIAALAFSIYYTRKHRIDFWNGGDVAIPGLVVAHAFGRLGCLMAGCCYGKPTGTDFGVRLHSDLVDVTLRGIPLHPVQLYESAALFILFAGLLWIFRTRKFQGQVFLTYLMIYPIIRSVVEVFRGDEIRGFVIDNVLSTSQFISIFIFLGAAVLLAVRMKSVRPRA